MDFPADPLTSSWWPYIIALIVGVVTWIRSYMGGSDCPSSQKIDGKRVIVTGSSSGIGFEVALLLANRGGQLILACRDDVAAASAVNDIKNRVKNSSVIAKHLDLASLKSIREFTDTLEWDRVDILINNAGLVFHPFEKTEDGFEMHFASNYLGHFLLTHLLLPKLKAAQNGRVINVSSQAHTVSEINLFDLNRESNYTPREAFGQSKLALVLMAGEMARRLKDTSVTINALNPGIVRSTKHMRHSPLSSSMMVKFAMYPWMWLLMKTPSQAAQTYIYLAVAPELTNISGKYFSDCQVTELTDCAKDEKVAAELYNKSCELVNVRPI
ncbi:retinol dehydrogenase 13-like [Ischnura elegans]|uniref:retinol dehydrogenase 13-like n=1 Tax=Ischnura elegans TaxID=197161 RepID=UPI001ED8A818|nr:retinol dehydrogenase 13-like [Ischnura elegans]XP_046401449.1 retinol dehydrogenase 13-like [Ischnura elegans]XP_046401450.1 retinol dehydrogenase 13-like [Ischnura elegans]XP_046401451.1 retinol dehydrogenase 13-like [Ischnura elegans]